MEFLDLQQYKYYLILYIFSAKTILFAEIIKLYTNKNIQIYIPFVKTLDEAGLEKDKVTVELGKILFEIRGTGFIKNDGSHYDNSPNIFNNIDKVIK